MTTDGKKIGFTPAEVRVLWPQSRRAVEEAAQAQERSDYLLSRSLTLLLYLAGVGYTLFDERKRSVLQHPNHSLPHHRPEADPIRCEAEGLAHEIHNDVMAKEPEIADAIEASIRRYAQIRRSK